MNDDLKSWEEGATGYLKVASEEINPFKKYVDTPQFVSLLGNVRRKKVLDIGCGNGEFCNILAAKGAIVIGLDGSPAMIREAKEAFPDCQFVLADIVKDKLPFKQQYFDIITAKMMLMNVFPLEIIAKIVFKILKTGSLFAVDIVHPLRPLLKKAKGKNTRYSQNINYFKEKNIGIQFSGKIMAYYHRPLQKYINDFIKAGFVLKEIKELGVNENIVKRFPELEDKLNQPVSLHLLFSK